MMGSFILCPCHLPVTLAIVASLAGGTVVGTFVRHNPYVIGVIVTALWVAGTWRGALLIRASNRATKLARSLDVG